MRIASICGGKSNLIKIASIYSAIENTKDINHLIIDIGTINKPYGKKLYSDLGLPDPYGFIDPQNHFETLNSIPRLAQKIKQHLVGLKLDAILIYGDLYPGVSAVIAASQINLRILHIEAGLRSFNLFDSEEINRIIIDRFSDYLLTTSHSAYRNLINEGVNRNKIFTIGNPMISTFRKLLKHARFDILNQFNLYDKPYGFISFHREENLFNKERLAKIIDGIEIIQAYFPLFFFANESTKRFLAKYNFDKRVSEFSRVIQIDTIPYLDYIGILSKSTFTITDGSGQQDESAYLGVPCFVIRQSTHSIDGVVYGNNIMVDLNIEDIPNLLRSKTNKISFNKQTYPPEWDFEPGERLTGLLKIIL